MFTRRIATVMISAPASVASAGLFQIFVFTAANQQADGKFYRQSSGRCLRRFIHSSVCLILFCILRAGKQLPAVSVISHPPMARTTSTLSPACNA
jgi:hypothetical protein